MYILLKKNSQDEAISITYNVIILIYKHNYGDVITDLFIR